MKTKGFKIVGLVIVGLMVVGGVGALGAVLGAQNRKVTTPVASPSVVVSVSPSPSPVEVAAPPPPPASPIPAPPPPAPVKTIKPRAARTAKAAPAPVQPPPAAPAVAAPVAAPPAPPAPPAPAPAPAPDPITPKVLWEGSGSSNQTTPKFTTQGSDWDMEWKFDCTAYGYESNFIVWPEGPGYLQPVNELSMGGSGVQHYHTGGTFFLEITTSCDWHVRVIG